MALTEFIELAPSVVDAGAPITLTASYDDFTLRLVIQYAGRPLERVPVADAPDPRDIDGAEESLHRFGVSLMTRLCDEIGFVQSGRHCSVRLSFR